jgi:hypothetical protein
MNMNHSISAPATTRRARSRRPWCLAVRSFSAFALLLTAVGSPLKAADPDAVLIWNEVMQRAAAPANPHFQSRGSAITQLAVFEAVNAIVGGYESYLGTIVAPAGASPEAAIAAAAYRTLVTLFPASINILNEARATSLAAIPDGPAKDAGIAVGEAAAAAMLQLRANDGSAQAQSVPYTPGNQPGDWQPAPPTFAVASLPGWGLVTPFGMESGWQFRLPPPPPLTSGKYRRDYNEVKLVGKIDASLDIRPQDRIDVARFFAVSSPVQVWNQAARQVSLAQGKTLPENARNFALLAMAMADASIATYESKYFYNFWRPLTAIRAGALDGNPQTLPDAGWFGLLATPAFPSYPSAHATLSTAARTVLERLLGKQDLDITLSSPATPIVLHYTKWRHISNDIDDARVYGGIHFRFEQNAGTRQGRDVGHYILDNYLRSPEEAAAAADE